MISFLKRFSPPSLLAVGDIGGDTESFCSVSEVERSFCSAFEIESLLIGTSGGVELY